MPFRPPTPLFAIGLLVGACTGSVSLPGDPQGECELAQVPSAPSIVTPAGGELKQPGELIRFEASPAAPLSAETREAEFELFLLAGDQPTTKIWTGSLQTSGATLAVNLDEGSFEAGFSTLDAWQSYAVRSRVREGGAACQFSEWSGYQDFRLDDGSEALFNEDEIRDLEITLSPESFSAISAEALPPGCVPYSRNYYPGSVTFDGVTYDNAGVRTKGGCGSSRDLSGKASFKINLSDFGDGSSCPVTRRARGLKHLTVNNQVQDGSATHERLAYQLYDLVGVPVPRRAPIRVFVNNLGNPGVGPELWGLYLNLESIDRRFLERRYEGTAAEGMLYEGTYFCDLTPENKPADENGPETCFSKKFDVDCSEPALGGDPFTYAPLISFIDQIAALPNGGFYPAITNFVDFDAYLSEWAAETIMNHWDGAIFDIRNNYRVYHDPAANKWVVIPTGMDQSWNEGQRPIDPWVPANIIARRCLEEKACEDAFAARLKEVLTIFENANFPARAEAIRTQIAAEVAADPRRESGDFSGRVDATINFISNRPAQINAWLAQHGY